MSALTPTPTRLALLANVDAGRVERVAGADWLRDAYNRKVDARCDEAEAAGWISLGPPEDWRGRTKQQWQLTDAGRAILDQHRRAES